MIDFLKISTRSPKKDTIEIYPKFIMKKSEDLMIRGGDFYAVWIEDKNIWSTDEQDVINLVDREIDNFYNSYQCPPDTTVIRKYMWDSSSGVIDSWHKYCQKQMRDNFHMLDENLTFSNDEITKKNYVSKTLNYPLQECPIPAYEKLISTLYSPEERHKIEWAIGAIVTGDSKKIQKFMVLYGGPGTGKSTILNVIQQLFEGYYSVFDAKALGSGSNSFALEAFASNPLIAIQHDGDLSRIEDNTRLNSIVSHELMTVNEKFKSTYANRFRCFLFMGTNKPVKITDAKSGILRRLIDVSPSGKKLSIKEYRTITKQIEFELGGIAYHCKEVYLSDPNRYDDYVPVEMMGASNDFYNFVVEGYNTFKRDDSTTLKAAWEMYRVFCEDAKVAYPASQRVLKEELKSYFWNYEEQVDNADGTRTRGYYSGFKTEMFDIERNKSKKSADDILVESGWLEFDEIDSIFDDECSDCQAQLASSKGTPMQEWAKVKSKLSSIDTHKLHYVKVPENHIVIDFDIPGPDGKKCFERNLEAANKWPKTYAELSKSGQGIHLHYIYSGDVNKLSRIYDDHIEIKVFTGGSSLRRLLTKCNDISIAPISSGLPLRGDKKLINFDGLKNEKALRTTIKKNLRKEYHADTRSSVDFIFKVLEDAYESGMKYDVNDLYNDIMAFAANSTNQSTYCMSLVDKMHFNSDEPGGPVDNYETPIVFYDVEVMPNLFIVCWKIAGEGKPVVKMINPSPKDIEGLIKYRLVGFNNRRYDNHILYGRLIGYSNEGLYDLSQRIINSKKGENNRYFFREAYNLSYTDIYDFASAANKKSLKKFEIELGIHHQELGLPWDQPVDQSLWDTVADYCVNDVLATEAVFNHLRGDWIARQILADISGLTVNDTTNTLSQRIIFGNNRKPQSEFNYRNLALPVGSDQYEDYLIKFGADYKFRVFDADGLPQYRDYIPGEVLPDGWSILPFFPGYKFEYGKSTYLDEEIGEGGKVYAEPGMYWGVWDADVTGQHPSSIIAEVLFGPRYTKAFKDIVDGRVGIKHKAWDQIEGLFDGKLRPYIQKVIDGELTVKELANAIKTVVNSVYGLTSASFENACRDPRNIDNIVAKRGSLFMTLLKREVQKLGYTVCHIKTDSIKIPNATPEIREFVLNFGKEYGYSFETEADFDRFCLVNNAVYIAKTKEGEWTATGAQFAVPYVFKTLFSKEPIEFNDLCETKEVKSALYLDMNENLPEGEHNYHFIGRVGLFCPIKPGCGGGILLRESKDKDGNIKYDSATGADGYRWLEAEMVRELGKEDDIDISYYKELVDAAVYGKGSGKNRKPGISDFGDFERFVSDDPYIPPDVYDVIPDLPWIPACGNKEIESCLKCPNFMPYGPHVECKLGHDVSDMESLMFSDYEMFNVR